jgi:hypothetical protein
MPWAGVGIGALLLPSLAPPTLLLACGRDGGRGSSSAAEAAANTLFVSKLAVIDTPEGGVSKLVVLRRLLSALAIDRLGKPPSAAAACCSLLLCGCWLLYHGSSSGEENHGKMSMM